jgi:hypothetical protein
LTCLGRNLRRTTSKGCRTVSAPRVAGGDAQRKVLSFPLVRLTWKAHVIQPEKTEATAVMRLGQSSASGKNKDDSDF